MMRECGEMHGFKIHNTPNSPYTTSNSFRNTPTPRTTQSQIREGQQLAHVHTRFILMLARWNAYRAHRHGSESPYPGLRVNPGSEPVQPPRLTGVWTVADTHTTHILNHLHSPHLCAHRSLGCSLFMLLYMYIKACVVAGHSPLVVVTHID